MIDAKCIVPETVLLKVAVEIRHISDDLHYLVLLPVCFTTLLNGYEKLQQVGVITVCLLTFNQDSVVGVRTQGHKITVQPIYFPPNKQVKLKVRK